MGNVWTKRFPKNTPENGNISSTDTRDVNKENENEEVQNENKREEEVDDDEDGEEPGMQVVSL